MKKAAYSGSATNPVAWVSAIVGASAILCLVGLGRPSLWIDEVHSFEFASLPSAWLVILNAAARDAYPPLYFLLLHAWMWLGSSEIWLRMLSVLFHLAAIPMMYVVARRMFARGAGTRDLAPGGRVALVAAVIVAASPFHLAFAREVRMYSMVAFLTLLSMWALSEFARTRSKRDFWIFCLTGLALIYTHFMCALVIIAQAVWFLFEPGRRRMVPVLGKWAAVLAIGFLPWSPFFLKAFLVTRGYGSEASPLLLVYWFLGSIGAGFEAAAWFLAASFAIVVGLAGMGLAAMQPGSYRRLLIAWAFVPVLVELAANLAGKPVFGARTLIVSTPAWLLMMANGIASAPRFRLCAWLPGVAGAVLAGAIAGYSYASFIGFGLVQAPAHRDALAHVLKEVRRGDAIVHSSTVTYHALHEYYIPRARARVADYLIEPQGKFSAGKLGSWFRDKWREIRATADPAGVLRTGADPNRISEEDFVALGVRRIWYFHTTEVGKSKIWRLIPGRYYAPRGDELATVPFSKFERLNDAYAGGVIASYPGLKLELYRRNR